MDNTTLDLNLNKIQEILKKNGIEESWEADFEKIDKDEVSFISEIQDIIDDSNNSNLTENDLSEAIQKRISTTKEIANKIASDIKKELTISVEENLKEDEYIEETPTATQVPPKKEVIKSGPDSYREPIA